MMVGGVVGWLGCSALSMFAWKSKGMSPSHASHGIAAIVEVQATRPSPPDTRSRHIFVLINNLISELLVNIQVSHTNHMACMARHVTCNHHYCLTVN